MGTFQRPGLLAGLGLAAMTVTALAADLPSRAAPPVFVPPVAAFSWTGFEAGLHSAYTFGSNNHVSTVGNGTTAGDTRPGYLNTEKGGFSNIGAGIAYNYQFNPGNSVVVGVAGDYDWVDLRKNDFVRANATDQSLYHQRLSHLGTANGRIGYAFDRLLVYGTGGAAFGDPGYGATFLAPNGDVRYFGGNSTNFRVGYNFGGGIAYAIPDDSFLNKFAIEKYLGFDKLLGFHATTTLKVEYIHYDLGNNNVTLGAANGATGTYSLRYHTEGNQVRAGLVYSFGGAAAPVVARY